MLIAGKPRRPLPDNEIDAIRAMLTARPRPAGLAERRQRLDELGTQYTVPDDVRVTLVEANSVAAEWTLSPQTDPARVILFLHGGAISPARSPAIGI
jgi:acetyl esterase/lipase